MSEQKPTIGRVVWYRDRHENRDVPAIITRVYDGDDIAQHRALSGVDYVDLVAFGATPNVFMAGYGSSAVPILMAAQSFPFIPRGIDKCQWRWPERS